MGFGLWDLGFDALLSISVSARRSSDTRCVLPAAVCSSDSPAAPTRSPSLFLLRDLAENGGFSVVGLAHLNHQLRPAADRDEAFCRDLAARLGLRIAVQNEDVKGYARGRNLSVEDAARRIRYDFMEQAADAAGRRPDRGRPHAGRSGGDIPAEADSRRWPDGTGGHLSAARPHHSPAARRLARGASRLPDGARRDGGSRTSRTRTSTIRGTGSATSCCPSSTAPRRGPTRPAIARAAGLTREDGSGSMSWRRSGTGAGG